MTREDLTGWTLISYGPVRWRGPKGTDNEGQNEDSLDERVRGK